MLQIAVAGAVKDTRRHAKDTIDTITVCCGFPQRYLLGVPANLLGSGLRLQVLQSWTQEQARNVIAICRNRFGWGTSSNHWGLLRPVGVSGFGASAVEGALTHPRTMYRKVAGKGLPLGYIVRVRFTSQLI